MLIVGFILVILLAGGVVVLIALSKGLRGFHFGHAMLDCPHCGKATRATDGKCRHCRQTFA